MWHDDDDADAQAFKTYANKHIHTEKRSALLLRGYVICECFNGEMWKFMFVVAAAAHGSPRITIACVLTVSTRKAWIMLTTLNRAKPDGTPTEKREI